ncbi:pyridoxal phosphate-dependent transferase [Gilbertella persicaria]|uniref:pyridoxal phosphate-dependent transferase n=1 Tax=Gilbertella persicaria TaxID=101096 RepID=UPI002220A814|nr:pyridoxal phosphate-dependent transferase [Gilbertella persicaria]KAI8063646.1 pyridoxal phosphate-dependent transferase [Gilbertella persicaria]
MLGKQVRDQFLFEPDYTPLNHGSYGALPKPLLSTLSELRQKVEQNPDRWLRRDMFPELDANKASIANLVHVNPQELVFVFNAMTGINTVARSLALQPSDKILYFNTAYNSVESTLEFIKDAEKIHLVRIDLAYPMCDQDVLDKIKRTIEYENSLQNGPIKVCFMDAISSVPAVLFPFKEAIQLVKQYHILSMVDGAHAIGHIPLDLSDLDPDFFITNCHKWLYAPRGCAVLYVPFRNQQLIHPAIINSAYNKSFQLEFAWPGTADFSNFMCINAALAFRESIGGEEAIMAYCHDLAVRGGHLVADILGTDLFYSPGLAMVNVRLPLTTDLPEHEVIQLFIDKLLYDHHCMAPVYQHNHTWYARLSAQVYNDLDDFKRVAKALQTVCLLLISTHIPING